MTSRAVADYHAPMMRIVLLGHAGLAPALRRAGHAVLTVGSMGDGFELPLRHPVTAARLAELLTERSFAPDVLVLADDGNVPSVVGLETLPYPLIFHSVDTFCNPWHVPFAHAFDHILVAQKDFVPLFTAEGHPAAWFPLYCLRADPPQSPDAWLAARDIPVAFVGTLSPKNIPDRLPFLRAFRKLHPLVYVQGDFEPVFRRARIVLNQTAASEMNYRCFEAMGCGAALLTDSLGHGLTDLFAEAVHVLPPYARLRAEAAAAGARWWLARPLKLAELALAGTEEVARRHTAEARAAGLTALCARLAEARAHESRLADLSRRRVFLSSAYGTLAAELTPDHEAMRLFYQQLAVETYRG